MYRMLIVLLSLFAAPAVVSAISHATNTPSADTRDMILSTSADDKGFLSNALADGYYTAENESSEVILFRKNGTRAIAAVFSGENGGMCIRADVREGIVDGHGVAFVFAKNKGGHVVTQDLREATAHFDLSKFTLSAESRTTGVTHANDARWWEKIHGGIADCDDLLRKINAP